MLGNRFLRLDDHYLRLENGFFLVKGYFLHLETDFYAWKLFSILIQSLSTYASSLSKLGNRFLRLDVGICHWRTISTLRELWDTKSLSSYMGLP